MRQGIIDFYTGKSLDRLSIRGYTVQIVVVIGLILITTMNCFANDSTEAQRYYDLGVSYIKSDLYEDGLKTLNQVAFLYPDSDVADNALFQLAMIREQVGDGKVKVATMHSLEAEREVLSRLSSSTAECILSNILTAINAHLTGKSVFDEGKNLAIAQYILALDYLNTLSQRYPGSDRREDSKLAFERIMVKMNELIPKPPKPPSPRIFFGVICALALIGIIIYKLAPSI